MIIQTLKIISDYNKITLINEIPRENISDFSGLKDPIPSCEIWIYNISGDI